MTRGKHKQMAERRHADNATFTELTALRRKNTELIRELAAVRQQLHDERQSRQRETRALRAERDENVAPLLQAAEAQIARCRIDAQRARALAKKRESTLRLLGSRTKDHFMTAHHATPLEAMEILLAFLPGTVDGLRLYGDEVTAPVAVKKAKKAHEMVEAVQQAHGQRRRPS